MFMGGMLSLVLKSSKILCWFLQKVELSTKNDLIAYPKHDFLIVT